MSAWGSAALLNTMRGMLIHRVMPEDVTEADVLSLAKACVSDWQPSWLPARVRFIGHDHPRSDGSYDTERLTISYGPDRRINEVSLG